MSKSLVWSVWVCHAVCCDAVYIVSSVNFKVQTFKQNKVGRYQVKFQPVHAFTLFCNRQWTMFGDFYYCKLYSTKYIHFEVILVRKSI